MNDVAIVDLKESTGEDLANVRKAEAFLLALPHDVECPMRTSHFLFAGMYVRTLFVPAGIVFTGARVNPETVMVVSGDVKLSVGDGSVRTLIGYNVLRCASKRKQLFEALTDASITIMYPSKARTLAEAEREFTDEWAELIHHEE